MQLSFNLSNLNIVMFTMVHVNDLAYTF